jgi:hypothetical protein
MSARTHWREGLLNDEGGGLQHARLVRPDDVPEMLAAALLGDRTAGSMLRAVSESIDRITRAPRSRPVLCAACPAPIRSPTGTTFGVLLPAVDAPRTVLAFALCPQCIAAASADPGAALLKAIRE